MIFATVNILRVPQKIWQVKKSKILNNDNNNNDDDDDDDDKRFVFSFKKKKLLINFANSSLVPLVRHKTANLVIFI